MNIIALPPDCIVSIFKQLDPQSYFLCRQVCQLFHRVISNDPKITSGKAALLLIIKKFSNIKEPTTDQLYSQITYICNLSPLILNSGSEQWEEQLLLATQLARSIPSPILRVKAYCSLMPIFNSQQAVQLYHESIDLYNTFYEFDRLAIWPKFLEVFPKIVSLMKTEKAISFLNSLFSFIPKKIWINSEEFVNTVLKIALEIASEDPKTSFKLIQEVFKFNFFKFNSKLLEDVFGKILINDPEIFNELLEFVFRPGRIDKFLVVIPFIIDLGISRIALKDKRCSIEMFKLSIQFILSLADVNQKNSLSYELTNKILSNLNDEAKEDALNYLALQKLSLEDTCFLMSMEKYKALWNLLPPNTHKFYHDCILFELVKHGSIFCDTMLTAYPEGALTFLECSLDRLNQCVKSSFGNCLTLRALNDCYDTFFKATTKAAIANPNAAVRIIEKSCRLPQDLFAELSTSISEVITVLSPTHPLVAGTVGLVGLMGINRSFYSNGYERRLATLKILRSFDNAEMDIVEFLSESQVQKFKNILEDLKGPDKLEGLLTLLENASQRILKNPRRDLKWLPILTECAMDIVHLSTSDVKKVWQLVFNFFEYISIESFLIFLKKTENQIEHDEFLINNYQKILDRILNLSGIGVRLRTLSLFLDTKLFKKGSKSYEIDALIKISKELSCPVYKEQFMKILINLLNQSDIPIEAAIPIFQLFLDHFTEKNEIKDLLLKYRTQNLFLMLPIIERYVSQFQALETQTSMLRDLLSDIPK